MHEKWFESSSFQKAAWARGWGFFPRLWLVSRSFPQLLRFCWSQGSACRPSPFFPRSPSFLGRPRTSQNARSFKSRETVRNTFWSSLRRKEGAWREAARARGLGECREPPLLITPPPRQSSSSAPGGVPAPPHSQPRRASSRDPPARYISPPRSSEAAAPLPRGEVAGGAGYTSSGSGSGGGHPYRAGGGLWGRAHSPPIAFGPRTRARLVGC